MTIHFIIISGKPAEQRSYLDLDLWNAALKNKVVNESRLLFLCIPLGIIQTIIAMKLLKK